MAAQPGEPGPAVAGAQALGYDGSADPRDPRAAPRSHGWVKARKRYAAFVHSAIFSLGLTFLLHVAQVGHALSAQSHWPSTGAVIVSFRDALVVLLRNLLVPFLEAVSLDPLMPESSGIDVWGFWIPGMLSLLLLAVASLGLATIQWGRSLHAVPYAFTAAVFLVWLAQAAESLVEISRWEDLGAAPSGRSHVALTQEVQQEMFKASYEAFTHVYREQQCNVTKRSSSSSPSMKCAGPSIEAQLMPVIVQEFCRARSPAAEPDFDARAAACKEQGQLMKLLPSTSLDGDTFYCRCWTATFDTLKIIARWIMLFWSGLLAGVLCVLYVAADPKLARMPARERREVLLFAAISMAALVCRVTIFPDGLWSGGLAPSEQER